MRPPADIHSGCRSRSPPAVGDDRGDRRFTAALCVMALQRYGPGARRRRHPGHRGSAGGVGSLPWRCSVGWATASSRPPDGSRRGDLPGHSGLRRLSTVPSSWRPANRFAKRGAGPVWWIRSAKPHPGQRPCADPLERLQWRRVAWCRAPISATVMPFHPARVTLYGINSVQNPNDERRRARVAARHDADGKLERMTKAKSA